MTFKSRIIYSQALGDDNIIVDLNSEAQKSRINSTPIDQAKQQTLCTMSSMLKHQPNSPSYTSLLFFQCWKYIMFAAKQIVIIHS